MTPNQLFPLYLHNITHSYFSTKLKEKHSYGIFCYDYLNFDGLKILYQKNMVMDLL